jgi:hypothetical protein
MRREPSLTFEGALGILGRHEHKTIEKIDKILGGIILGGGAVTGAVALGVTPLAPLVAFGVIWGWVEQKGLAIDLLKNAVDAVSSRASGLRGLERRELIVAAHSTITVAALFEAIQAARGAEFYAHLKVSDEEKVRIISRTEKAVGRESTTALYAMEIPAPSATAGFEENAVNIANLQEAWAEYFRHFLDGLADAKDEESRINWRTVLSSAIERYRAHYISLAARVPEFAIWAQLGEHAATRELVRESNADVISALNANREALNRIATLLAAGRSDAYIEGSTDASSSMTRLHFPKLQAAVNWANTGILEEPIIPADPDRYPSELTIPLVKDIYINPRYRVPNVDDRARQPANEQWWDEYDSRDDFDVFFASYVTSADATRCPMLLLGHPGAGKSLLTKVFAARLPQSQYMAVRVPLRRVTADARIHRQIEEALEISTNRQIAWSELAEQSADAIRVILLDGLDELLQATEHDRRSYLEDVMDFQEREANQRRPVAVVVTSRTVVTDRVRIPDGTTIVKLDPFNDADIANWIGRWKRANATAITAGTVGELTLTAARRQPELAEQPLLLLMLALYAVDRTLPPLDEEMATADLYRRLLEGFARREAAKDLGIGHDPSPNDLEQRAQDHLERLAIAALGMFNRGRQDITESELIEDLSVLTSRQMVGSRPGQRIIAEFFFVHAPEARTHSNGATNGHQRAYEFLHATFSEYLVTRRIMDEIVDITLAASTGLRGRTEIHDEMLFALLSHQVLAARKSMLDFAQEIFTNLSEGVRSRVLEICELLLSTYRNRHGSDWYAAYRPATPDQVRQLACYSANLVALRCLLTADSAGVPLTQLLRTSGDSLAKWHGTPILWKAGLDADGLQAMLTAIEMSGKPPRLHAKVDRSSTRMPLEISLARLVNDVATEVYLRYGAASTGVTYFIDGDSWGDAMSSWLNAAIVGGTYTPLLAEPPEQTPDDQILNVAERIFRFLRCTDRSQVHEGLLRLLFSLPRKFDIDRRALATAVIFNPNLRTTIPELAEDEVYGQYSTIVKAMTAPKIKYAVVNLSRLSDANIAAILEFMDAYRE